MYFGIDTNWSSSSYVYVVIITYSTTKVHILLEKSRIFLRSKMGKQANAVLSKTHYDKKLVDSYLDTLDLPQNQRRGYAEQRCSNPQCTRTDMHVHVRNTTPEKAYATDVPLWYKTGETKDPQKRGSIRTMQRIMNVVIDFECPSAPWIAERIGLLFRRMLIEQGLAPHDLPLYLSGAGIHIVINIPSIHILDEQHAVLINDAIKDVIRVQYIPLFEKAKGYVQETTNTECSAITLIALDTARLLSAPGTWRPSRKKDDHSSLQHGILRSVYDQDALRRIEWQNLQTAILYAATQVNIEQENTIVRQRLAEKIEQQKDQFKIERTFTRAELQPFQRAFHLNKFGYDMPLAVAARLDWYIDQKKASKDLPYREDGRTIDRSRLAASMYHMLARVSTPEIAYAFRDLVNEKAMNKFETAEEIDADARRVLSKFERRGEKSVQLKIQQQKPQNFFEQAVHMLLRPAELFEENTVSKDVFLEKYKELCENHGQKPLGQNQVTTALEQQGIQSTRKTIHGKKETVYTGVQFREE